MFHLNRWSITNEAAAWKAAGVELPRSPKAFLDEILNKRFANPYIPDTPQRIATDTSQKVGIRFRETLKSYVKREDLNPADLTAIPLAIATWCRYLLGIDDAGKPFTLSPDPLLENFQTALQYEMLAGTGAVRCTFETYIALEKNENVR